MNARRHRAISCAASRGSILRVHVRIGSALDPFGDDVDEEGGSHDPRRRPVDPRRYLLRDAEGVHAAIAARALTRAHHVEAPLLDRVYRVLYEGLGCEEGLLELMTLPAGRDVGRFQS